MCWRLRYIIQLINRKISLKTPKKWETYGGKICLSASFKLASGHVLVINQIHPPPPLTIACHEKKKNMGIPRDHYKDLSVDLFHTMIPFLFLFLRKWTTNRPWPTPWPTPRFLPTTIQRTLRTDMPNCSVADCKKEKLGSHWLQVHPQCNTICVSWFRLSTDKLSTEAT